MNEIARLGIPSQQAMLDRYIELSGRPAPEDWSFYKVFVLFRLAAINQGVYKRGLDGNAASEHFLEALPSVRRLAANPRTEVAVVEAGNHLEPESHLAAPALDDPDQLAVGIEPPAAPEGDAVDDRGLRAARTDVGLQNQRAVDIAALGELAPDRLDRAVPASSPVEQPREQRARVEARHAAPVDRSGPRDERRRMGIRDERVVRERRVRRAAPAHRRATSPVSAAAIPAATAPRSAP